MACCVAMALLMTFVRGAWYRLFPRRRPTPPGFAPPASRPAPGLGETASAASTDPSAAEPWRCPALAGAGVGLGVGTVSHAMLLTTLLATGLARSQGDATTWQLRDAALIVLGLSGLVVALLHREPRRRLLAPTAQPAAVTTLGLTWFALGLVDMHVLDLVVLMHHPVLLDLFFHGAGLAIVVLTLPALLQRLTSTPDHLLGVPA